MNRPHRRRQRQHVVSSATSASTRSSVAGSKPGRTRTTRPLGSAISIGSGTTGETSDTTCTGRLGDDAEIGLAAAGGAGEAIEAAVLEGAALLIHDALEVLGLLDLLAAVPRADVGGDDLVAIGDGPPPGTCERRMSQA
ncbi:hypothetical protein [Sorangium sp. So ce542]|uniref:hypothetical protein n=1 Tax=Sorangium sp. So ce542 TaxID=3133316 RepID=UPI003F5D7F3A